MNDGVWKDIPAMDLSDTMIRTKANPRIQTRSASKEVNGYVIPIINELENFVQPAQWPRQVYCTVALPRTVKGPHLHKKRWGLFTCIAGNIKIVVRIEGRFYTYHSGEAHEFRTIQVPAGVPAALVNEGDLPASILNMPAPPWDPNDPDDWDVSFGDYDFFQKA